MVCYAFVDATVRCVASAAICFQPFLAAMFSLHVACRELGVPVSPLPDVGRGPLKNHEFKSSGFTGAATDLESLLSPSLQGHMLESSCLILRVFGSNPRAS